MFDVVFFFFPQFHNFQKRVYWLNKSESLIEKQDWLWLLSVGIIFLKSTPLWINFEMNIAAIILTDSNKIWDVCLYV